MPDPQEFENRLFYNGQMDTDSSPEYVKNGSYGRAFNVRPYNSETGSVGVITNMQGNTLVEYDFGLYDGAFIRVIGSKLDLKRNRIYWFIYANTSDNIEKGYVLYYDYTTEDIVTVFEDPNEDFQKQNVLQFSKDGILKSVSILYDDDIGDTLLWTDAITEPKKLNVKAGINRFNSYTDNTTGFTVGQIKFANINNSLLKTVIFLPCRCVTATNDPPIYNLTTGELTPASWEIISIGEVYTPYLLPTMFYQKPITPYFSPNATFNYDETGYQDVNGVATFLRRKSFQFRYKYVYFDGQESEWSPISEAVMTKEPTSAIFSQGATLVELEFPTPKSVRVRIPVVTLRADGFDADTVVTAPNSMISRVKVAVRTVPNSFAPEDWYQFMDIQYTDLYKYELSPQSVATGFPGLDDAGTYFYNWDTNSFRWPEQTESLPIRTTTITVEYDGTQTLIPVDVLDTTTLFYNVPKSCIAQDVIDNRAVFGAGRFGMDVSNNTIRNIEDSLTLDLQPFLVDFDISNTESAINGWNTSATSTLITGGGATARIVFDLAGALVVADFDEAFFYNFDILFAAEATGGTENINLLSQISGQSSGIPAEYATLKDFLETVVLQELQNVAPFVSVTVTVNNTTGQMTIDFTLTNGGSWISIDIASINNFKSGLAFYNLSSYLPERTFKNHSIQQYGLVLQDEAGRLTTVIKPDSLAIEIPHFLQDDLSIVKYKALLSGLSNLVLPTDVAAIHLLRKRSESYSNFIQFSLSERNTVQQSWNWNRPYTVGFENLELDDNNGNGILDDPNQKNLYISLNSVNGGNGGAYESLLKASILDFLPQEGDILRFLYRMNNDGDIIEKYDASFTILNYSELWNTVVVDFSAIEDSEPYLADYLESNNEAASGLFFETRILCEIIKRGTLSEQEFFYEVAAQYTCTDGLVDVNPANDSISLYGDTYLKLRGYCTEYNLTLSTGSTFQNFPLQDKLYNDFSPTANQGTGRANAFLQVLARNNRYFSEVNRDNLINYSEQSIQNTDVKRYGTVYDANIQEVDNVFGRIELLHAEGDILDIYQEDKRSRVYSGRGITTELSGAERVIASQNNVFSDVIYQKGAYGISRDANSFSVNGYQRYYTDAKRGNVYRESMDGITVISEVGMSGYFKNLFKNYRNSYTTPIIRGVVDERVDEYILSVTYSAVFNAVLTEETTFLFLAFQIPSGISAFTDQIDSGDPILIDITPTGKFKPVEFSVNEQDSYGTVFVLQKPSTGSPVAGDTIRVVLPITETLVFSERTGGWTTFLSYKSEWLSNGIQSYHSFLDGQMYLHDIGNTDYNTFFGETFPSSFEVITNQNPQLTKFFLTVGVKTKFPSVEVEQGGVTTSEEQQSYIPNACFQNKEGTQWARLLGDGIGVEVNNGDRLRGRWLKVNVVLQEPEVNTELAEVLGVVFNQKVSGFSL